MPPVLVQEYLFQRIREKLSPGDSLVEVIASALFISNDSAYRRIRGETPLVLEEARSLCENFSISLDEILSSKPGNISFIAMKVDDHEKSFEEYLRGILKNLSQVNAAGESKEIIYITKDIPVFYNFLYRPLFAFRYFFWMKSIIQHPGFTNTSFSSDLPGEQVIKLGSEILELYNKIPSTEIWNTECINSTIAQVEYYREAGYFKSQDDVEAVYDSLGKMVEHIREQASAGSKFMPGESSNSKKENFMFFFNRVALGDNSILARVDERKNVFLVYDVLNYLFTADEEFCEDVYGKMQMLMRKSTLLSNSSEKQRNMFFNTLLKKIPQASSITNTEMT